MRTTTFPFGEILPEPAKIFFLRRIQEAWGFAIILLAGILGVALATWSVSDPSFNHATDAPVRNAFGVKGAIVADLVMQLIGVSSIALLAPLALIGWRILTHRPIPRRARQSLYWLLGVACSAAVASLLPTTDRWPLPTGLGGVLGDALITLPKHYFSPLGITLCGILLLIAAILALTASAGFGSPFGDQSDECESATPRNSAHEYFKAEYNSKTIRDAKSWMTFRSIFGALISPFAHFIGIFMKYAKRQSTHTYSNHLNNDDPLMRSQSQHGSDRVDQVHFPNNLPKAKLDTQRPSVNTSFNSQNSRFRDDGVLPRGIGKPLFNNAGKYVAPAVSFLTTSKRTTTNITEESLEQNTRLLEGVLEDFSIKGDVISVHPGPVVTLYEFEPAPGIKSSRVIGLADDIARSMSAISARVAVVPGRNAIGIELPNPRRETVFLRELVASPDFTDTKHKLAIALGKTIGGEPVIVDLAKMPHLLVAGTTGSGKSVAINTMILSLLYRLKPQECRLIMVDPKMLELSVYDGIPHLLTPVVTDPKKAVVALKWAVREMEDRYKKMSKLGVRNIDGFNARVTEARAKGEIITRTVQTGFDRETGEAIYEQEQMDLSALPYIVVIVDEMADLMMVAGKEIEGAIQRLAQMARAAGIHLIMATQRPSVDVITGTIKANFPTRISFQVTSKIDSRTILGEMGAEQLLGQGDMLYMAGGGRISRVHGPFVSDAEVEKVVAHLKMQGQPEYLDAVTVEDEPTDEDGDAPVGAAEGDESSDLYDRAVAIVLRDKKCSTSYVQRRLSVGYNKAASLVERMEKEGVVGAANHAGKRAILIGGGIDRGTFDMDAD
jgi:DNA segregation ATPase FtsK/SpoIIIE, S-DNA-T family